MAETRLISSLVLIGSTGCTEDPYAWPEPLEIQWQGERVGIAVSDEVPPLCAGTPSYLDGVVPALERAGGEPSQWPDVSYFVLPRDAVLDACRADSIVGCAAEGKVYTSFPLAVVVHEFVHSVRERPGGDARQPGISFFEEGLAQLYDKGELYDSRPPAVFAEEDIGQLALEHVDVSPPWASRHTAAQFLGTLADTYGDEATWDFVSATGAMRDGAPLPAIFEEHFPETFNAFSDRAIVDYCSWWELGRHVYECEQPGIPIADGLEVAATLDGPVMDCDVPGVLGPHGTTDDLSMWTTRTLEVEEAGPWFVHSRFSEALRLPEDDGAHEIRITRCGGGCSLNEDAPYWFTSRDNSVYIFPAAGRYLIRFRRALDNPGYTSITFTDDRRPFE